MHDSPILLGIETSCDDTAAAVISGGRLLSSIVSSQSEHQEYGGVVPELASRAHQRVIFPLVRAALEQADVGMGDLHGVAATRGPGLAGSLLVGLSFAKALALSLGIPFLGINHLEGHVYSLFISDNPPAFPFLCLIVSGGHTQLVRVDTGFSHQVMGKTRDDAAGEAFDKVAKLLNLGYPGGPEIEEAARSGDPRFVRFPRTSLDAYDYSFSGIKTSVLYYLNQFTESDRLTHLDKHLSDISASFQDAVIDMLVGPVAQAVDETGITDIAVVGGVSANRALLERLSALADRNKGRIFVPNMKYCMDNAAMIAVAAHHRFLAGLTDPLSLTADPSLALI